MIRTLIGLLTLAAMIIGGWYLLKLVNKGTMDENDVRLIIRFSDAHGVPMGGGVLHKGVRVGEVLKVDIAPDDSGVLMEMSIAQKFHHTLRQRSRFWVVRPHFGGLAQGASGLDTLIKDPYVEFDTPDLSSPILKSGSLVYGQSTPPIPEEDRFANKNQKKQNPLIFKLRFPQAFGLTEGAKVLYRDVMVGSVLGVDLSLDGRSVEVDLLIYDRYRETARTDSLFWVAKPNVEFGFNLTSFLNVRDLSKILTGAAISYVTPTEGKGSPIKKGTLINGKTEAVVDLDDYQGPMVSIEPLDKKGLPSGYSPNIELTGVTFAFTEGDWIKDESYIFQGTGVMLKDAAGKVMVLTARTLADGAYSSSDVFSKPDIVKTDLKVRLADSSVYDASTVWTDPDGRDLVMIALSGADIPNAFPIPEFSKDEETDEYYMLLAFRDDKPQKIQAQPIPKDKVLNKGNKVRTFDSSLNLEIREWYGAVLTDRDGNIVGIVGREEAKSDEISISILHEAPLEGNK